jgi:hypothetical protein
MNLFLLARAGQDDPPDSRVNFGVGLIFAVAVVGFALVYGYVKFRVWRYARAKARAGALGTLDEWRRKG